MFFRITPPIFHFALNALFQFRFGNIRIASQLQIYPALRVRPM